MFSSWKEFITWEKSTLDTIDVKKTYIDIAGDFMAGVLLSQIVYWYLPSKDGKSKLRVKKDGHYWIAKKRDEWYEEIRFSEANYKTAIKKLEKKNLVVRERFKFAGAPTTHVRLNVPEFLRSINDLMIEKENNLEDDLKDFSDYLDQEITAEPLASLDSVESTKSIRRNQPNGNGEINQMNSVKSNESLTKNTTENITKNTYKDYQNKNLNPNLKNKELDIYDVLWNIEIPKDLKHKIKVKIANQQLNHLSIQNLLDLQDAYLYQIQQDFVKPDAPYDDDFYINDQIFSETIMKMLETVKEINNMKGLVKDWVQRRVDFKMRESHFYNTSTYREENEPDND
ncbi:hypothetical protein NC797_07625 [Aquibacillus sp. 3ASR75-11]|uniref:Uncharacterized protein n=1 Tax=Terrihalobacillus insolitus TaxID=2950438 RepID=A0A9X4ANB7_9BACI|nr:hypothetical protein [Terrihalobacillus insolitus]MDC3424375.1 hypothetical protein [Terrihalobacillus insolitus]